MENKFSQEQARLDMVMETIASQIDKVEETTDRHKKEVIHTRKYFWDDVKVNMDTFDDFLETVISLRQQAQALSISQSTHKQAYDRLAKLKRMEKVPYFGRIDFTEEGTETTEKIYIGISTLTDDSDEDFLIYDWRAPISSVYYDYSPGPAHYDTPEEGRISGLLENKWQYLIKDGVIESMFDTTLTIGDEILQQVLGKGTDKQIRGIVATIQKEQNEIIRHDRGRLLVVQGVAGSGKTSAALQRIAYLLYKYREWLRADQIVLFSPNTMFNHYVSNVLPELGEENMQQVTFQEYLHHRLSKTFQVEDPYEQLEYVLTGAGAPSYGARVASIQLKASLQFFEAMKAYRDSLETSGMIFKGIKFRGKWIVTAKEMAERFYHHDTSLRFHHRLEKLTEWLYEQLDKAERRERIKPWVQAEIELLSKDDYQKVYRYLQKKQGFTETSFDDGERERKILGRMIVRRKTKPLRKWIENLRFVDMKKMYQQLFSPTRGIQQWMGEKVSAQWNDICSFTNTTLDEGRLLYEDATPFLLLKELIEGFQINAAVKHVLVDEAQDYSPFQFEFLKRLFPAAKMTVLGDFNQAIFAHASEVTDFQMLTRLYGPEETDMIHLTRSYRSTKQIVEFTRGIVPEGKKIIPFEREGEKPILTTVSDQHHLHQSIREKVAELQIKNYHTIAIICKSATESEVAYKGLNIKDLKLMRSDTSEYEQGIVIIPAYLAKGIEFDAVIIYNASDEVYGDEHVRRLFYTACTRAMHELQLYSIGTPSTFFNQIVSECFVRNEEAEIIE